MPVGIMHGEFVSWSGTPRAGELHVRNRQDAIYGCQYDARTYVERDHQMIAVAALAAGDPVEVVADHKPGSTTCYARMVHVIDKRPRPHLRASAGAIEAFTPHGNIAFGGIVVRHAPGTITLKTRTGEETLLLRPDTRFMGDGALLVNTHVFVRAGRNVEGDIEAYQIVWGDILH